MYVKLGLLAAAAFAMGAIAIAHPGHPPVVPAKAAYSATQAPMPFELFRGSRIILSGRVNGTPTDMMLDSGAGMTVLDSAFAEKLGLAGGAPISVRGAAGEVPGRMVSGVTLSAGALNLTGLTVLVIDMSPISRGIGRPIPVVLGSDAFKAGVVAIDFPRRTIDFAPKGSFDPPAKAVRLDLGDKQGLPAVKLSVAGLPPIESHLDLGNGGAVLLAKDYWSGQPTLAGLRHAETQVGGVGGMKTARRVTLPAIEIAGIRFDNVPATLNEDSTALPTSGGNIGIDLLKSFVVTFDSAGGAVYLEKAGDVPIIEKERAGLRTELAGDRLNVVYVSPDGPAAAAGLKAGDAIVAVDGTKVDANFYERPDWTRDAAGRAVTLTHGDGTSVKVTLADYY